MKSELRLDFEQKNLHSFFDRIRFWFFIRKIYWQKKLAIWEASLDKAYFENNFFEQLTYNDTEDRKQLALLHEPPYDKQDHVSIEAIEKRIARAKAVKEGHRGTDDLIDDLVKYKEMLDLWFK